MRFSYQVALTTENEDGDEVERVLDVTADFSPGSPGSMYDRYGDPGDPPEPDEIDIIRIDEGGKQVRYSDFNDADAQLIYDAGFEAAGDEAYERRHGI